MAKSKVREPVTRERAIRVAVSLADAGGIESVSMRKLAAELGIEAMSLYYVKGRYPCGSCVRGICGPSASKPVRHLVTPRSVTLTR